MSLQQFFEANPSAARRTIGSPRPVNLFAGFNPVRDLLRNVQRSYDPVEEAKKFNARQGQSPARGSGKYYGPGFMSDAAIFPDGRGRVGGGNAGASIQSPMGSNSSGSSWTAAVTPGARARTERMNELSQQAGGQNYSFETAFPNEFAGAKSAAPVVEQYRKDLAADPLANAPALIDQRSQEYGQRADIAKWMEANRNAPKGADGMNVVDRFLAKQRPAAQSLADSPVFNSPDADRQVAEAGYGGMKYDPESTKQLQAFEAGADWAASGGGAMQGAKFDQGTMEFGGDALRTRQTPNRAVAEAGYQGMKLDPATAPEMGTLGTGSTWTGQGVNQLQGMPMTAATAETNRQINFEGSPLPEANAAQAASKEADDLLEVYKRNILGFGS